MARIYFYIYIYISRRTRLSLACRNCNSSSYTDECRVERCDFAGGVGGWFKKSDPACLFISDTPEGQHLRAVDGCLCDQIDALTDAVDFTGGHQTAVIMIADRALMMQEDAPGTTFPHLERVV